MPTNHLYTHYLFIPLKISHGPYFSLSFPKSSFIYANHLLLRQHILEILCNVLSHIPTLIQRCLFDVLKTANMVNMVGLVNPARVSANSGSLTQRSRLLANRLQKTDGEQIFFMPYNRGYVSQHDFLCMMQCSRHWVLVIVRPKRETLYFLDPLPGN
ncbi:hypothetical protein PRUPE_2G055400 [Prunus persica]|uniref:Ubiquitin-like protease family profile domain-containing protein n=1 Tax=Prunus persica TaxID=3760 RepID=A0A251QBV5_PRUPE|nr:hypothetical protein PRUPE_2G055400 [Prunus persica]ONI21251.1 hypothetical protein PRUPE_2G055400 [Prunus persica]ONI21252.1 hypothetical protein PRUPE_2G055400 [Prunus persica]